LRINRCLFMTSSCEYARAIKLTYSFQTLNRPNSDPRIRLCWCQVTPESVPDSVFTSRIRWGEVTASSLQRPTLISFDVNLFTLSPSWLSSSTRGDQLIFREVFVFSISIHSTFMWVTQQIRCVSYSTDFMSLLPTLVNFEIYMFDQTECPSILASPSHSLDFQKNVVQWLLSFDRKRLCCDNTLLISWSFLASDEIRLRREKV
jgi:hypothetical protein